MVCFYFLQPIGCDGYYVCTRRIINDVVVYPSIGTYDNDIVMWIIAYGRGTCRAYEVVVKSNGILQVLCSPSEFYMPYSKKLQTIIVYVC